jgi:hypothetical protein
VRWQAACAKIDVMKDDHEGGGARMILGAVMILLLALVFVAFGKTIIRNVNGGYKRVDTINDASNGLLNQ